MSMFTQTDSVDNNQNIDEPFIEDSNLQENGDDNTWNDEQRYAVGDAVVFSTDWTTETIINQISKGTIDLNPNFQRRDAWTQEEKSKFIESLILGFPIPPIVLALNKNIRGKYIVLDGKQRLLSISQFINSTLKLKNLKIKNNLNNLTFDQMARDILLSDEISQFENQPIRTIVIKNYPHEAFLYEVFLRLNTGSKALSPQELRQALHPGSFTAFIDNHSSESIALRDILKKSKPDFRMRDAELLLRELSLKFFITKYKGNLKEFLDNACITLNEDWGRQEKNILAYSNEFEKAHNFTISIFNKNAYQKYSNGTFVNRFNRAILDSMMFFFVEENVRECLNDKKEQILSAFIEMCEQDKRYIESIESTTKSIPATMYRLKAWGERLVSLGAPIKLDVLIVDNE